MDSLPPENLQKLMAQFRLLQFYRTSKNDAKFKGLEAELDKTLSAMESKATAVNEDFNSAVIMLDRLAYLYCPVRRMRGGMSRPSQAISDADFSAGNKYKRRAMQLRNKVFTDKAARTETHREMLNWYASLGRKSEVAEQTSILSKLVGSTDPNKINPPAAPCPACGMG